MNIDRDKVNVTTPQIAGLNTGLGVNFQRSAKLERSLLRSMNMTDDELMDIARPFAADGGRWPSDLIGAMRAVVEACATVCDAAEDTGNSRGIERDVFIWNRAAKYCANRLRERSNVKVRGCALAQSQRNEVERT